MIDFRRSRAKALVFAAACMIVAGGGLIASNMGFKYNRRLVATGPNSKSGINAVGLPYIPLTEVNTAFGLFKDLFFSNVTVQTIQRFLPATDTYQVYNFAAPNFPLLPGQGLFVKVGNNADYLCGGTEDPDAIITLKAAGPGSLTGSNFLALPYHSTSATAADLFAELGPENIQSVQMFLPKTNTFQVYSFGAPDFPLLPCQAYFVKMGHTVSFKPSHY